MKVGDQVSGKPVGALAEVELPDTVTGTYDEQEIEFAGKKDKIQYVVFDGVHVPCDNIRPAGRREKVTSLG